MKYILLLFVFTTCSTSIKEHENDFIKINWLTNVKTTIRISSNHYSDFVMDKSGNSYIACFFAESGVDYIYITKISPDGKIIWEMDKPNKGRATAISIDGDDNLWVTGFYSGFLDFGEKTDNNPLGSSMFLAKFDVDGKCVQIISSIGSAIGFNVHVNKNGDLLLNGTCSSKLQLGNKSIEKEESQTDEYFIALFDKYGNCQSLEYFPLYTSRVRSDADGYFYLAGRFNQPFEFHEFRGSTKDSYDNDAFLLKLNAKGKAQWFKQYGKVGNARYGYRSDEGFFDMVIEKNGAITVAALSELPYTESGMELLEKENTLKTVIVTFDKSGDILKEKIIAQHANEGSIQTLLKTIGGQYFLTFSAKQGSVVEGEPISFEGDFRSVVLKYDSDWNLIDMQYPEDGTDVIFRAANSFENNVFYSGHYRGEIVFGENKIQNDGRHSLFMMKVD